MTTKNVPVGHRTLTLKQIGPSMSASFSPNLHAWMRRHGHWYKDGGVLDTVFRVRSGTRLAEAFGTGTLMIGAAYDQYDGDSDFSGVRLIAALCEGAAAARYCYAGAMHALERVDDFWDEYLKVGRCAIDPQHKEHFIGNRFSIAGDTRTCLWCGATHQRVLTPRTVFDESWSVI